MRREVVIDTNAYSAFMRGVPDAIEVVREAEIIIFSPIVIGELLSGFALGNKAKQNQEELDAFLGDPKVILLTINALTSKEYAAVYLKLRKKGTPIPTNDLWIAALAKQLKVGVFTYDEHFNKVSGLSVVRKASDFF